MNTLISDKNNQLLKAPNNFDPLFLCFFIGYCSFLHAHGN